MAKLKKETVETLKRNPIYTTDFNKIKSYTDSLNLYKAMQMQDKLMGPDTWAARRAERLKDREEERVDREFLDFEYDKDGLPKRDKNGNVIAKYKDTKRKVIIKGIDIGKDTPQHPDWWEYSKLKEKRGNADFKSEKDMYDNGAFTFKEDFDLIKYYKSLGFTDENIMYHSSADVVHPKIKPIGTYFDGDALSPIYKKPIQPYMLPKDELNKITSKGIVSEDEEVELPELYKTKNQKVNVKEPSEHFLDISEPDGKGTQRIYFDTRKQLDAFQKESPMLKTGSFSRAKIKPEVLEILKKKK